MAEIIMKWNGALEPPRFQSVPPGLLDVRFDRGKWVSSDGRESAFVDALNGFLVQPDGKLVQYIGTESEFQSADRTIRVWFDSKRDAWVIVTDATPGDSFLLLETDGNLLQENGSEIII